MEIEDQVISEMTQGQVVVTEEHLKELQEVSRLANQYAKNARAKSTEKSYRSDWQDFEQWCTAKRLVALPADPCTVACYLADRAAQPFTDPKGKEQGPLKVSSIARSTKFY